MNRPHIRILYGTQTGNSLDVAEQLARTARRYLFPVSVNDMESWTLDALRSEQVCIFVCSTTGQGDTPDNMQAFWKSLLRRSIPADALRGVRVAVFGLGDSSYQKFNIVGRRLHQRLIDIGADAFYVVGDGNDQHPLGYDGELIPWSRGLWERLFQFYPLAPGTEILAEGLKPLPRYSVNVCSAATPVVIPNSDSLAYGAQRPFLARVTRNERITATDHFQDVRHIELNTWGSGFQYEPGDVAVIMPRNTEESVRRFLSVCGWDPATLVSVHAGPDAPPVTLPSDPCTLQTLCETYLDIAGVPRRYFFEQLSHFTDDEAHVTRLRYFGTPDGMDDMRRYCTKEARSYYEVLEDFTSAKLPLEYLFDVIPRLKPRMFSLASSPLAHPDQLHVTVAVVNYLTPFKKQRAGLCSTWLASLPLNATIPVWIKTGTLRLPAQLVHPLIMVGPGTGCAPFRSFLHQLHALKQKGVTLPRVYFFFGCRNEAKDFLYRDELRQFALEGTLTACYVAFSRDQPRKIYVQDRIRDHSVEVWTALGEENGCFYLCGSSTNMPQDVHRALVAVCRKEGGVTEAEAVGWLKNLDRERRYQMETWS